MSYNSQFGAPEDPGGHVSYLILADGVFFQQVLITATDLEDVFTLIFLNAHLQLLW